MLTLDELKGRVGDLDSHESIPVPRYGQVFGEIGKRFIEVNENLWRASEAIVEATQGYEDGAQIVTDREDIGEITEETVWTKKGTAAPGAIDMDRRTEVMDMMGIQRQLIFPMMGIFAWIQACGGGQIWIPKATEEQIALGKEAVDAYNRWAGQITEKYGSRMRMVGMVLSGEEGLTVDALIAKTTELIATGVKAVMISGGEPPAGLSPGDLKLDPFYASLAERNITLTFHPPAGLGFRRSEVWEFGTVHPGYNVATVIAHPHENFLASMVAGGVFERHPTLRVAFVETQSHWIGPIAEHLDNLSLHLKDGNPLPLKPSEYIARNVRVSVLPEEPVEIWLERWPHLQSVYCYASDFPHFEGGQYSMKKMYERIAPLGDAVVEKFFITNSEWVLPIEA